MKYKTSIPELYALTLKAGDDLVNEDDFCKIIRSTVQSMLYRVFSMVKCAALRLIPKLYFTL